MMETKTKDWNEHLECLIDLRDSIDLDKITILTGGNGTGKSVIRKLLQTICKRNNVNVWTCSMDKRAGFDSSVGGMMVFGRDCEWLPTSINTFNSIDGFDKAKDSYGILDEIEIGMSEESQYGIALYINSKLEEYKKKNRGLLIITHSKWLVRVINADTFLNVEGMTKEEWLNREIIPTDFKRLKKDSSALFREIQNRTGKK